MINSNLGRIFQRFQDYVPLIFPTTSVNHQLKNVSLAVDR